MGENIRNPAVLPARPARENVEDPAALAASRFDQGEAYRCWRPHGTKTWLLFCTLAGRGYFRSEDGRTAIQAAPGDLHLYAPGALQDYGTVPGGRWAFHWVHFKARPQWTAWLAWPAVKSVRGLGAVRVAFVAARRRLDDAFGDLHRDSRLEGAWRSELASNALERILLLAREGLDAAGGRQPDARVQATIERIVTRPGDRYSVPALARDVHLSASRFAHLFKRETGRSVIEAVRDARLREAAQLLRLTPSPVKEIANRLGFATPFHFSNQFRRHFGWSPRAYRTMRRSG